VFGDPVCNAAIEDGLRRAAGRFNELQFAKSYSSVTLPIEWFGNQLPEPFREQVRLCRVFTIKAGQRAPHEEIHRNSIQRLVSYHGTGAVNCAQPGGVDRAYTRRQIVSPDLASEEDISLCWDVVPENTWHFPEACGTGPWYGVAFHSAGENDIIDEYVTHTQ